MIPFAITGRKGLGGVQMRGVAVAKAMGVPFLPVEDIANYRVDTLLLVKYDRGAERVRSACERLIWDPLDVFSATNPDCDPSRYWSAEHQRLRFDAIVATSDACARTMSLLPVPVWNLPHHCDETLYPSCDPDGPIVYAGRERYIRAALPFVSEAAKSLGRRLVLDYSKASHHALPGASLILHPRCPPFATPLNRYCKPQVKAENAAAVGVPLLASDCPCVPPWVMQRTNWLSPQILESMRHALENWRWHRGPVRLTDHVVALQQRLKSWG